jgi:hypothetical protein
VTVATLAELNGFRERLVKALASDVRELQDQNGERVVYRSIAEIRSALAAIEGEIARASRSSSTIRFRTTKGL